jgi:hypothetical protein
MHRRHTTPLAALTAPVSTAPGFLNLSWRWSYRGITLMDFKLEESSIPERRGS